jgi:hypothetical protein
MTVNIDVVCPTSFGNQKSKYTYVITWMDNTDVQFTNTCIVYVKFVLLIHDNIA